MISSRLAATAAFILCSSDNTAEVGRLTAEEFDRQWKSPSLPRFVSLSTTSAEWNNSNWVRINADRQDGWRSELLAVLDKLSDDIDQIVLCLDDFFCLGPVEEDRLLDFIALARAENIAYLRLVPLERSLVGRAWLKFINRGSSYLRISEAEPYYSSLQIAIWSRSHLSRMLELRGSIWEFEHTRVPGVPHYAITGRPPIRYKHIVERGRWLPYAKSLVNKAGLSLPPSGRQSWNWRYDISHRIGRLRFMIFGYAVLKIKNSLRKP